MKHLYEITNGEAGNSYVRVYAWADNTMQALALANIEFKQAGRSVMNLGIVPLFSDGMSEFCTYPSDEGWELGEEEEG